MKSSKDTSVMPDDVIVSKIYFIRGEKVMLDRDLADLYGVSTSNLNLAVKRHLNRFPEDFMFQLTEKEFRALMFQIETSNLKPGRGGIRKLPKVFTEQGVAMLSSVLNSDRAVETNIRIIRIFTRLRQMLLSHKDILLKLEALEKQVVKNSEDVRVIFSALRQLLQHPDKPRKRIGFRRQDE